MSKDFYQFKNEKGDVAFLIGLVDYLSDRLSQICDYGSTLEADIFPFPNNDLQYLNEEVKKRTRTYAQELDNFDVDKIDQIDLNKLQINASDVSDYMYFKMKKYSSNVNMKEEVDEFLSTIKWQLNAPIEIYEPIQLPDTNISVLGEIYFAFAWDYFFIAYEGFCVLLILGTVE